ncbi:MAG: type II toxin-antitoxin system PemK/MazF family toxin [Klebsiella michiganensis]|uniref:Type II toxin-antitoxin system PemK/MazF family toxin n=1 Tax=Superficieibacter electus TaxID=2022662 RepID=A0A2P5GL73_9ENTR|nr:type II toxin-antitoxin system PemK/MazF family toxin [Superficieibacter electus]MDU4392243.1 type II toxin-antitoxin system PemK/MazF family toxin [Klebsiella michiganensis]MDU4436854.1 type II toxin-antitoxin system PemK/MazF family toxin [Pluralibacter gergoviae]POP42693.1 hypothetical protein CHU33_18815 [Superficieibacter electus]POP45769.1 hypothetical protein CHU32_19190 [Superficieibacter electus]
MALNFSPKVGEILECNFGNYPVGQDGQIVTNFYDGRMPPEMIKNRLVVVLNGKINGNACIVVPLSTTCDRDKLNRGMHVEIADDVIDELQFFDRQIRWAKADQVQQVSRNRLNRARTYRGYLNQSLPRDIVADIQRAVIKSINAVSLIN